jgi:hypothetical protein
VLAFLAAGETGHDFSIVRMAQTLRLKGWLQFLHCDPIGAEQDGD